MYDTRPDLHSYVLSLRRLWWVVAATVGVAVLAAVATGASEASRVQAVVQVPSLDSLSAVDDYGTLFDTVSEAVFLSEDLNETLEPSDARDFDVVVRSGRPTIDVEISTEDETSADAALAELDEVLATTWAERSALQLQPAVSSAQAKAELARTALTETSSSAGEDSSVQRIRLTEQIIDAESLVAAVQDFVDTPPKATVLDSVTTSGTSVTSFLIAIVGGAFAGVGLVILATVLDRQVRRRSIVERNGLTVVAVSALGSPFEAVPAALAAASNGPVDTTVVVPVNKVSLAEVAGALESDPDFREVRALDSTFVDNPDFVRDVRGADAVILVAEAGHCTYANLFEAARTATASGARNVCAVLVCSNRRALGEALS